LERGKVVLVAVLDWAAGAVWEWALVWVMEEEGDEVVIEGVGTGDD
jgi:hypothetical protein